MSVCLASCVCHLISVAIVAQGSIFKYVEFCPLLTPYPPLVDMFDMEKPKPFQIRAQPDRAYESSDRTGPDSQISWPDPAGPESELFKHFNYQVWDINSHKIRSLDTNLVSKVNKKKKSWNFFWNFFDFFFDKPCKVWAYWTNLI